MAQPLGSEELADLLRVAFAGAELAHSPYSGVRVGAALLTDDGAVFSGCNVENASYGLTICAERVAAVQAVAKGEKRFRAIAIATSLDKPMMPCGACRQFLAEFAPGLEVVVQGRSGEPVRTTLDALLPDAFTRGDLGV